MQQFEYHEAADIFPMLEGSDFEEFSQDISANKLLLDATEVAALLGVSRRHVQAMDCSGRLGPMPIHLGRAVRWRRDEIVEWVAAGCPPRHKWMQMKGQD
jgi:excisionase family DNA binding protein